MAGRLSASGFKAERRIAKARTTGATSLNLSGLKLSVLPDSIGDLSDLTDLYLDSNQLSVLPDSIGNLTNLIRLYLSGNQLSVLPEWIANLTTLTDLYLDGNQLAVLPDSIGNLTNLTVLSLFATQLTVVPDSIGNLTKLITLDLSRNQLSVLPEWIGNLTNLTNLYLGGNQWSQLPDSIGNLTNLTNLYLDANQWSVLPDSIGNLTNLIALNLDANQWSVLPDWIGKLTNLTILYLEYNQLSVLPDWIGNLPNLTALYLADNPLVSPPPEVVATGTEAVLTYLRASRRGSTQQWVSKLLVVGEGEVGKTSLIKALAGADHDPHELTTHGMRISELQLDHPSEPDVRMTMFTWDFGGQEIYHATHQFFLTDQSLFLLVWNPRAGHLQSRVRYWLDIITARAPEAPIILVASHGDERRPSDLPLPDLQLKYPQIVGSITVDSATRTGIADLLAEVAAHAAGLPNMGRPWPDEWTAAAASLGDGTRTHVSDAEMRHTMVQAGVTAPHEQSLLAGLLHQRGVILRYNGPRQTADIVILQPQWLNTRISRILDSSEVAVQAGLLTQADRDREWAEVEPGMREHFLDMMETYDLAYRITDPAQPAAVAAVVELLPHQAPDYQERWDQAGGNQLSVRYELSVMPPGIPTWFIAREHRFTTGTHWRTGVLLRDRTGLHLALLRADPEAKTIDLAVRGPVPQGFLEVLDDGLTLLLDRYPGLAVRRRVPCPHLGPARCPEYFDYRRLLNRLAHGRTDDECDAYHSVPIQTLLAGIAPTRRDTEALTEGDLRRILAEEVGASQRATLKAVRAMQQTHCPSVFTVTPSGRKRPGKTVHVLRLYCEEPDAWHALDGNDGSYEIAELDPWLATYGPAAAHVLALIARTLPIAGAAAGIGAHLLDGHLRQDLESTRALLAHKIPNHLGMLDDPDPRRTLLPENPRDPRARAERDADFRDLEAMLRTLDPSRHWGGLDRVITPEGTTLYLCHKHARNYT